jgi:hypothetical protein
VKQHWSVSISICHYINNTTFNLQTHGSYRQGVLQMPSPATPYTYFSLSDITLNILPAWSPVVGYMSTEILSVTSASSFDQCRHSYNLHSDAIGMLVKWLSLTQTVHQQLASTHSEDWRNATCVYCLPGMFPGNRTGFANCNWTSGKMCDSSLLDLCSWFLMVAYGLYLLNTTTNDIQKA